MIKQEDFLFGGGGGGGGGGKIVCKNQFCVKHAKFFEPIFEYQSPMHEKNIKPEFLLLDIVLIVKTFGGGFGGEASPPHPPVDETL